MMNRKNQDEPDSAGKILAAAARGIAAGIAAVLVTITAASLVLTLPADPDPMIGPVSAAAMLVGALTAGIIAARKVKSNQAAAAASAGAGIAVILCVAAVIMGGTVNAAAAIRCVLCIGTALAGSLTAKQKHTVPRHPGAAARRRLARR